MSFFQSEIMRSFYKTANAKGWVKKEPELIRTASESKSLEPSEDLFMDMCRLSEALRNKGYVKQAESLDKKIAAYKVAETHLYRVHDEDGDALIEHAHPEGDFKVEDAADGMGEVEKLTTQHKKIVDIVNKQPTGKLASLAEQIVKKAQDPFESKAPQRAGAGELSSVATLKKALNALGTELLKVGPYSFKHNSVKPFMFGQGHLASLYIDFGGNYDLLTRLGNMYYQLFGGKQPLKENMRSYFKTLNSNQLKTLLDKFGFNFASYGHADVDSITDAVWSEYERTRAKAESMSAELHRKVENMKRDLGVAVNGINSFTSKDTSTPKDSAAFASFVKRRLPQISKTTYWPVRFLKAFGQDTSGISKLLGDIEYYADRAEQEAGKVIKDMVPQNRVNATIGRLKSILRMINSDEGLKAEHSKRYDNSPSLIESLQGMIGLLEEHGGGGFSEIQRVFRAANYKSYDDLDRDTIELNEDIKRQLSGVA